MSQYRRILWAIAAALLSVALLAACGDDDDDGGGASATTTVPKAAVKEVPFTGSAENGLPTSYPEPRKENLTIGFVSPLQATEPVQIIFKGAQEKVKELGGKSILLDANLDPDKQVSLLEQLVARKVDAIGFVPIAEPKLLAPVLKKAAAAKIPVIGVDVTPGVPKPVPGFVSQVWQQRDRLVYLEVKAAAEALGPGAKVGLVEFAHPVPLFNFNAARTRHWAEQFGLEIVGSAKTPDDTTVGGQNAATELLNRHKDLDGVLGYNDEPAVGAATAARAAGMRDLKTFGINAASLGTGAIKDGRLTATVFLDDAEIGRQMAMGAYDAAQGTKIPPVVLAGKPFIVTKENVDEAQQG